MSAREEAAKWDAMDQPLEAAKAYESAITESGTTVETFLDLAVLYFKCTDPGYFSQHHLPDDFVDLAWRRANAVLGHAEILFGWHPEIAFWRRYFSFVRLGDEPFDDECERLAGSGKSLVPYFYLFTTKRGEQYREKAQELLDAVKSGRTARERYIRSILEPRLTKRRRPNAPRSQAAPTS